MVAVALVSFTTAVVLWAVSSLSMVLPCTVRLEFV